MITRGWSQAQLQDHRFRGENPPGEPRGMPEAGFSEEAGSKAVMARERDIESLQPGRTVQATNPQVDCLLTIESSSFVGLPAIAGNGNDSTGLVLKDARARVLIRRES